LCDHKTPKPHASPTLRDDAVDFQRIGALARIMTTLFIQSTGRGVAAHPE